MLVSWDVPLYYLVARYQHVGAMLTLSSLKMKVASLSATLVPIKHITLSHWYLSSTLHCHIGTYQAHYTVTLVPIKHITLSHW